MLSHRTGRSLIAAAIVATVLLLAQPGSASAQVISVTPGYGNPAIGSIWGNSGYDPRYSATLPGYSVYAPGTAWGSAYGPLGGYNYGYSVPGYGLGYSGLGYGGLGYGGLGYGSYPYSSSHYGYHPYQHHYYHSYGQRW